MDGDLLTEVGLMLTQLRYARRALEDIERSTARYAGFAFASALSQGAAFGAPPLQGGALKVYLVNINDLQPGGGLGGFLESLLGGVGRFFGGLLGGFVGGTMSGFLLPTIVTSMVDLAARVEHILKMLGISFDAAKEKGNEKKDKKDEGPTLIAQLDSIKEILKAFTALFGAAQNPDTSGTLVKPKTDEGVQWLEILKTADGLVNGISRVVDGLIILVPTLVGALASVIVHLRDVQRSVLDLLSFLLREIFLLRGVVLFTLWDTIAGAARLGSFVLKTLNEALSTVITSLAGVFSKVFDAALELLRFLATGIKDTVDTLLKWLIETVWKALTILGDSKVFRVAVYIVQALPAILPPLLALVQNVTIDPSALKKASDLTIESAQFKGTPKDLALPTFPDLEKTLAPPAKVADLSKTLTDAMDGVKADLKTAFDTSIGALDKIARKMDDAKNDKTFLDALDAREKLLRDSSQKLADALKSSQEELAKRPPTGLEAIATAYEDWLTQGKGMEKILGKIEEHFKTTPGSPLLPPIATEVLPVRATVEIKELIIELDPGEKAKQGEAAPAAEPEPMLAEQDPFERDHEYAVRGFVAPAGTPYGLA